MFAGGMFNIRVWLGQTFPITEFNGKDEAFAPALSLYRARTL